MWAASHNQVATLKFLQEQGADFSMVGHQAETALLFAAANGHAQVLQVLLSAGVDINHICQVDIPLFFFLNVSVRCTYIVADSDILIKDTRRNCYVMKKK